MEGRRNAAKEGGRREWRMTCRMRQAERDVQNDLGKKRCVDRDR